MEKKKRIDPESDPIDLLIIVKTREEMDKIYNEYWKHKSYLVFREGDTDILDEPNKVLHFWYFAQSEDMTDEEFTEFKVDRQQHIELFGPDNPLTRHMEDDECRQYQIANNPTYMHICVTTIVERIDHLTITCFDIWDSEEEDV